MALETVLKTLVTKVKARRRRLALAAFYIPELRVYLLQGLDGICAKTISQAFFVCEETCTSHSKHDKIPMHTCVPSMWPGQQASTMSKYLKLMHFYSGNSQALYTEQWS